MAALKEMRDVVKLPVTEGAGLEDMNDDGETPLVMVSWRGSGNIIELLLDLGADTNARNMFGRTVYSIAKL